MLCTLGIVATVRVEIPDGELLDAVVDMIDEDYTTMKNLLDKNKDRINLDVGFLDISNALSTLEISEITGVDAREKCIYDGG